MHLNPVLRERRISDAVVCRLAAQLAAGACGVNVTDVQSGRRSQRASLARHIGMYLAHTTASFPLAAVAAHFSRDRTSVAHACRRIEDRRDDPKFDAQMIELESLFRAICGEMK